MNRLCTVALVLSLLATTFGAQAQSVHYSGPHGIAIRIDTVARPNAGAIGFNVYSGTRLEAAVRFTSLGLISCQHPQARRLGAEVELDYRDLTANHDAGFTLKASSVVLSARTGHFPVVTFQLHVLNFDKVSWQNVVGQQPFHFLKIEMPDARVWQQGGWLNATPLADMFPLLLDVHAGTPEISGYHYNREWSNTTPVSALPLPVIGLWNPKSGHYAAWDFMQNRLLTNSERNIAVGYCNRLILPASVPQYLEPSQVLPPASPNKWPNESLSTRVDRRNASRFISMVYPYGGIGYQQCVYPGIHVALHASARLVFSDSLPSSDDPNSFLWATYWHDKNIRKRLPRAPITADLAFLGKAAHLATIPDGPTGSLFGGIGHFGVPGTTLISGWDRQDEGAVAAPVAHKDTAALTALRMEAIKLAAAAIHFKAGGLNCIYWRQPLTGKWVSAWGGAPVTTLHNSPGFTAARLLLDLAYYDNDRQYLPLVDGALNWAKQIVWTRDEFPDVPSSPFAIGGTTAVAFLLDYYQDYHNDPERRESALQALQLAHSFTYRYMVMWAGDSSRTDRLDSAFLWEPNSGRDWTGAACSNEVIWDLDMVAETAVYTGDPILRWALTGTLSRWHRLYQNVYHPSIADYTTADFAEGYGLAPGNPYGYPGGRAAYGFGGTLQLLDPVGDSMARVIAGPKAALVFDRGSHSIVLSEYRWARAGQFAFKLQGIPGTADVTVTAPFSAIGSEPVVLQYGVVRTIPLVIRNANSLWTVVVRGVKSNQWVIVGAPDLTNSTPESFTVPLTQRKNPVTIAECAPFVPIKLTRDTRLRTSWQSANFAGLTGGLRWLWSIPFVISPDVTGTESHSMLPDPGVAPMDACFILYAPGTGEKIPSPITSNGKPANLIWPKPSLAWRGWPTCISTQLEEVGYLLPPHSRLVGIQPRGAVIVAASGLPHVTVASTIQLRERLRSGAKELQALALHTLQINALREEASAVPPDRIAAFEPVQQNNPAYTLLAEGMFIPKLNVLSPQQIASSVTFNASRYPVALYLDGEDYAVDGFKPQEIVAAVKRYLNSGGVLVLMAHLPFPLFYPLNASGDEQPAMALLPQVGLPIYNAIETPPTDSPMVNLEPNQTVLPDIPNSFPYPDGDPRLRSVNAALIPAGATFKPIYKVIGATGTDYGAAAGLLTLPAVPGKPAGRILYISDTLINDPTHGAQIITAAIGWLTKIIQRKN